MFRSVKRLYEIIAKESTLFPPSAHKKFSSFHTAKNVQLWTLLNDGVKRNRLPYLKIMLKKSYVCQNFLPFLEPKLEDFLSLTTHEMLPIFFVYQKTMPSIQYKITLDLDFVILFFYCGLNGLIDCFSQKLFSKFQDVCQILTTIPNQWFSTVQWCLFA